jgi:hypothetical protein
LNTKKIVAHSTISFVAARMGSLNEFRKLTFGLVKTAEQTASYYDKYPKYPLGEGYPLVGLLSTHLPSHLLTLRKQCSNVQP